MQCPINSWSPQKASKYCPCLSGYFRVNRSDFDSPCIEYPSEPKNLTVYHLDQATIKLRWDAIDNYAANKVQYKLQCYKCKENFYSSSNVDTALSSIEPSISNAKFYNSNRLRNRMTTYPMINSTHRRNKVNSVCAEKSPCENYVRFSPKKDQIFKNK
jgi:hypothetical protein